MMFNAIGPLELLIIFTIVLMVFGSDKLPELARGLGKGIREVRRAANMVRNEIMSETDLRIDNPLENELKEIKNTLEQEPTLDPRLSDERVDSDESLGEKEDGSIQPGLDSNEGASSKAKNVKSQSGSKS